MSEFRLEQKYRAEAGAPNGALVFRIHHLSGAALSPARLCYSCMTRPSRDHRVEGGTLVRHFANHVEILPPKGLMLRPGDVWQVEIHGLSHKPVNRTQGAMAAWFETDDGPLTIATGDLQAAVALDELNSHYDLANVTTTAAEQGGEWVLNGRKGYNAQSV